MNEPPARRASEARPSGTRPSVTVVARRRFAATAADVLAEGLRAAAGRAREPAPEDDRDRTGTAADAVSVALAGRSTPRDVYRRLAGLPDLPWTRIEVYFGDERRVPPDHPESNYRMAREALLHRLPTAPAAVHRMEGEAEDPEAAARSYAERLPEALDLLILGIGEDGHTASLFPGGPAAREEVRRVVPAATPAEPRERLTITPPVIRAARRVVVLAAGGGKAEAVARALERGWDPASCPAQLARDGLWVLDEAAAAGIRERA